MGASRRSFIVRRGTQFLLDLTMEERVLMSFKRIRVARLPALSVLIAVLLSLCSTAFAIERSLAGISLGSKASTVLVKYGNPTRISVGTVSAMVTVPGQPESRQAPGGNPYVPPMPMPMPTPMPERGMDAYNPSYNPFGTGPYGVPPAGGLPPLGGMMPPGTMPGGQTLPGQPQQQIVTQQEVTWTYEFTKGPASGDTVEFIVSEGGLVTQITVGGATPWSLSKTSLGIQLGDDYKKVLLKYGYPEGHAYVGKFLRASYVDKHRVMFTFLNRKVVGITIALPE